MADVFQDVFRAVATNLSNFRKDQPGDSFRGWLFTITKNKIRDHLRRQRAQPVAPGGSDAAQQLGQIPDPFKSSMTRPVTIRITGWCIGPWTSSAASSRTRPGRHSGGATVDGHFPADIAVDLGITVNAVYKAKFRVLRRLRTELRDQID